MKKRGFKMLPKWLRTETNDHVLIRVEICLAIGVEESQDDLPEGFTDDLKKAIKEIGAGVITSSICPIHRQKFRGTAREMLANSLIKPDPNKT